MDQKGSHRFLTERALTRRELLAAATMLGLPAASIAGENFWNRKDPSAWTEDEIVFLTTRSPWAKISRVDLKAKGRDRGGSPDNGPTPFGVNQAEPEKSLDKPASATITWESALPLFDAQHVKLPAQFLGHYVIGVKDFPILVDAGPEREGPQQLMDWLKNSATLQAKSRQSVEAGVVATAREGSLVLFGFLRELIPLSTKDRDVDFSLDTNQAAVKARFEPKEMIYHGELAL